jgi:dTDP-4-dehydrorhamnose reductase
MKVLVLGHNGMLGNAVFLYLKQYYDVYVVEHRYPSKEFINEVCNFNGEWVVNCIGAVPNKHSDFSVNYELPIFLDKLNMFGIIHCSTDDLSSNSPYSISKQIASDWISLHSKNTRTIRSSIIGMGGGLLSWFLSNKEVDGYVKCMWNGITTLEWAKYCKLIIDGVLTGTNLSLVTDCVSKYELLYIINNVYDHKATIIPNFSVVCNNCIDGIYVGNIETKLKELKYFYENMLYYNNIL